MQILYGAGGHTITGNTIILRGLDEGNWHMDGVQWYNEGSTFNFQSVIAHNFIYFNSKYSTSRGTGIYFTTGKGNRLLIYNNIIAMAMTASDGIDLIKGIGDGNLSARIFNNTVIMGSPISTTLNMVGLDTLVLENNIFINDSSASKEIAMINTTGIFYFASDYNQWYDRNRTWDNWNGTTGQSWPNWRNIGYDVHSNLGAVSFTNPWGTNISDYSLNHDSAGIDEGSYLSAFFKTDILGTTRPQGAAWDRGAIESLNDTIPKPSSK